MRRPGLRVTLLCCVRTLHASSRLPCLPCSVVLKNKYVGKEGMFRVSQAVTGRHGRFLPVPPAEGVEPECIVHASIKVCGWNKSRGVALLIRLQDGTYLVLDGNSRITYLSWHYGPDAELHVTRCATMCNATMCNAQQAGQVGDAVGEALRARCCHAT